MRNEVLGETDMSLAPLTHWFPFAFNCFISSSHWERGGLVGDGGGRGAEPTSDPLDRILFLSFSFFLLCRVNALHISSVWTLDLCNYCPGLDLSHYSLTVPSLDWLELLGDHQCSGSLLIKVGTCNIESKLYRVEKSSCFNKRTWIASRRWWQAHGSFCCRSPQVALTCLQVLEFLLVSVNTKSSMALMR